MKTNLGYWKQENVYGSLRMASNSQSRKRFADRRCAAQTRRLKAFIRSLILEPCQLIVGLDPAVEAPSKQTDRIVDISELGTTWCTKHSLSTIGNFCEACEQESANGRVPMRKPAPVDHAGYSDPGQMNMAISVHAAMSQVPVRGHTGKVVLNDFQRFKLEQDVLNQDKGPTYGTCPFCGAPGITRERRPDGNDRCSAGHTYPSRQSMESVQSVSNDSGRLVTGGGQGVTP